MSVFAIMAMVARIPATLRWAGLIASLALPLAGIVGTFVWKASDLSEKLQMSRMELATTRTALAGSEQARKIEGDHNAAVIAALTKRAEAAEQHAAQDETIRRGVNRAKPSNACSTSPAIRQLLDGVRGKQGKPAPDRRPARPH